MNRRGFVASLFAAFISACTRTPRRLTVADCPPDGLPNTTYDIFQDSSHVAWKDDVTRAVPLEFDALKRPRSSQTHALYLGSIRTTNYGTTEDNDTKRYVWSYYNRKKTTQTWTWSTVVNKFLRVS